jgi:glycerol-3-phosphate acyltransferase PlsX
MRDHVNILIDAMGGDNAPEAIISGAADALRERKDFSVTLFGSEPVIREYLAKYKHDRDRIFERLAVVNCKEEITSTDIPTVAIKAKSDSSMVRGLKMLKEGFGDAFISAGNSGALLTGSLLITGRIDSVIRPALGAIIPSGDKFALLIDAGLNSNLRPESYVQFARFGIEYMKIVTKCKDPLVGLLNIGKEDNKGNVETKSAHSLLSESGLNYYGNIEGNNIVEGIVDVIVTDGFTGNVCLKLLEGTSNYIFSRMKAQFRVDILHKLAAFIMRSDMNKFKANLNPDIVGGAPILGVDGLIIKSHGNSKAKTIMNVVLKTVSLAENDIVGNIKRSLENTVCTNDTY